MQERKERKSLGGLWIVLGLIAVPVCLFISARDGHEELFGKEDGTGPKPAWRLPALKTPEPAGSSNGVAVAASDSGAVRTVAAPVSGGGAAAPASSNAPGRIMVAENVGEDRVRQKPRIVRKRLEPEATKRLTSAPQNIKTKLITTGRAENANWGVCGMCAFELTYYVDCDAEIVEKRETDAGEVRVVEKRTFNKVRQLLELSKADAALALYETLPMDRVLDAMTTAGNVLASVGDVGTGLALSEGTEMMDNVLRSVDGKSVGELMARLGVSVSDEMRATIDDFVTKQVNSIFKPSRLEGRSYLLTYYQDKESGAPLNVDVTYGDGTEIATQEEFLVLRRVNAFLDANFVPDKGCSPGDTWTVDCSEFDSLFDPYVEGGYCGTVTVERFDNYDGGDWHLGMRPGNVSMKSDKGQTTGELRIDGGEARVDADNVFVKALVVKGKGSMKNLTEHHLLFRSRFDGDCSFYGTMESKPKKK